MLGQCPIVNSPFNVGGKRKNKVWGLRTHLFKRFAFSQAQLMLENPCNKNTAATDFSVLHKRKKKNKLPC